MFSGKLLVYILAIIITFVFPAKTFAVETPAFPLCVNPTGTLKAQYNSGVHGIPGDPNTHTGSDAVYSINDTQLVQCFCDENGFGIQTNWLKVGQISDQDRKTYENDGWIYIPNGALWGLENTPYIAKNLTYSCKGSSQGSGDGLSDGKSDGKSDGRGSSQGYSASIEDVMGLASTGDIQTTYTFFLSGVVLLILGATLRRKSS